MERYQGIPLFLTDDTLTAERYGLDGLLTRHLGEEGKFTKVEPVSYTHLVISSAGSQLVCETTPTGVVTALESTVIPSY